MISFIKKNSFELASFFSTFFIASILLLNTNMRFPNDDQFILYRYVDNIISGNGFVFNVGEKVLGSTTPLFTIISSFLALVLSSISIPDVVAFLNILLFSSSAVFLFKISKNIFEVDEFFSYILVLIFSFSLSKMIPEGMETPLFIFLTLGSLYYLVTNRQYLASVLLGLTVLTRPDAIMVVFVFFIYCFLNFDHRKTVKLFIITSLVLIPWLVFGTYYFGSFIPQSLLAKTHSSDIVRMPFYQAFKVILSNISRLYWGSLIDFENIKLQVLINLSPVILSFVFAIKYKLNKKTWVFFLVPLLYLLSFSLSNPIMFPWYISQIEPFWILLSFVGIYFLYKNFNQKYFLIILVICLFFPFLSYVNRVTNKDMGSKMPLFIVSQYLNNNIVEGQSVGISNIGIVSFVTKAYIVDFFGLVREDSVYYYPIENGCFDKNELYVIPPNLIRSSYPDWLVAGDGEMDPCFKKSLWFKSNYKESFRLGSLAVYKSK